MRLIRCVGVFHKWTPAEETNEAGLRLVCKRCGKIRRGDGIEVTGNSNFRGGPSGAGL